VQRTAVRGASLCGMLSSKREHERRVLGAQPFNVLRYESGQHYDSHYDIFEPESYGPQPSQRVRLPALQQAA
jgi:hypothetical protein